MTQSKVFVADTTKPSPRSARRLCNILKSLSPLHPVFALMRRSIAKCLPTTSCLQSCNGWNSSCQHRSCVIKGYRSLFLIKHMRLDV